MLQRVANSTTSFPAQAVTSGQSIAKSARHRTPRQRAKEAATWVLGGKIVQPTTRLAATVFQVSVQLVAEEIAKIRDHEEVYGIKPATALDHLWDAMTPTERAAFVLEHEASIWSVLDHITS